MPKPTASRTANIPIADVARIEPRSRFLLPACLFDLFFMCFPLCCKRRPIYANNYHGRTDSGLKSTRSAFATGKSGLVVRTLLIDPEVLVCVVSAALVLRRSEEHTSELQSLAYLVCRLLLEKKKKRR